MDCPKCVGTLEPLQVDIVSVNDVEIRTQAGKEWGTMISDRIEGSEKSDKLELDKCFSCTGIWFDKGELKKIRPIFYYIVKILELIFIYTKEVCFHLICLEFL